MKADDEKKVSIIIIVIEEGILNLAYIKLGIYY